MKRAGAVAFAVVGLLLAVAGRPTGQRAAGGPVLPNPVMFVTQVPVRSDFTTIGSTFGNHRGEPGAAGRGGDLWIRYTDGTLRNLTAAAGFGGSGMLTGNRAIGVRDPSIHWSGTKALVSVVVGGPTAQFDMTAYVWQMYEVTGFGSPTGTVTFTRVPRQPERFNNVSPIYGTDDRIIFTSDRPRNGAALLYPQLDEYEEAPSTTGLWSLDPAHGDLRLLNHAPSGDFTPIVDSFGRVLFTQWDHLQRDQQADADAERLKPGSTSCRPVPYGTFNYASETSSSFDPDDRREVFPEPRSCRADLLPSGVVGQDFNQFLPWQIQEDGREGETLDHIGRHDLGMYVGPAFAGDPNIVPFSRRYGDRRRFAAIRTGIFQMKESPTEPGTYYGVDAQEFSVHASGQIIAFSAPVDAHSDDIVLRYITHRDTYGSDDTPNHSGRYREPLPMSDGSLIAVHTKQKGEEATRGGLTESTYDFRLTTLVRSGDVWVPGEPLTSGIRKSVSFWDPDTLATYDGPLWELNPVEVRARPRPSQFRREIESPEQQMFDRAQVPIAVFREWLAKNDLALAVTRNVTSRDDLDRQQPYNLRVPGGVETRGAAGRTYDVTQLQFFAGEQLRGVGAIGGRSPRPGRRVIAQPLVADARLPSGSSATVAVAADGSTAALVPTGRALSWQLTDGAAPVVRERLWVTFQPGEIRTCPSCHGLSTLDQAGRLPPQNPPLALLALLNAWKDREHKAGR